MKFSIPGILNGLIMYSMFKNIYRGIKKVRQTEANNIKAIKTKSRSYQIPSLKDPKDYK